jgi:cell division transport system permease protein
MVVTLFVIGSLIFFSAILDTVLTYTKDKVDVNVYFVTSASEESILALKRAVEALPEVELVEYSTREQELDAFRKRHENDQLTLQALDELGENPLGAALAIKTKEPSQYEGVAEFLTEQGTVQSDGSSIVDKVNYYQNKEVIDQLTRIIAAAETTGMIVTIVFIFASVLITFNTIRLAIYVSREEIGIMRLVGASNFYARGPFVIEGMMYGAFAAVIVLVLFWIITFWLGSKTEVFFGEMNINIFSYYVSNFAKIFFVIVLSGVGLGAVSSWLAVRKYLKV